MTQSYFAISGSGGPFPVRRVLRVLVVDDDKDTVLTLSTLLRTEGHDTKGVHNGKEALDAIGEFDPDVVILDIAMPVISGWDLAREIRTRYGSKRPTLVAVSAQYNKGADRILSQITGFDYYVAKPCDPNVLLKLVADVKTGA